MDDTSQTPKNAVQSDANTPTGAMLWRRLCRCFTDALAILCSRPAVMVLWLVAAAAAAMVAHAFDASGIAWVRAEIPPHVTGLAKDISHWGELHLGPLILVAIVWIAGWLMGRSSLVAAAAAAVLGACVGGLLVQLPKWVFGRPRPSAQMVDAFLWFQGASRFHSFPSGHAMHCFAIVGAVSALSPRLGTVLAVPAAVVAAARFLALAHYPSDIAAGSVLGLGVGLLFGHAVRRQFIAEGHGSAKSSKLI
jgi:undecaprenyl-diphosphatase